MERELRLLVAAALCRTQFGCRIQPAHRPVRLRIEKPIELVVDYLKTL